MPSLDIAVKLAHRLLAVTSSSRRKEVRGAATYIKSVIIITIAEPSFYANGDSASSCRDGRPQDD
jgi:hypothetical protein